MMNIIELSMVLWHFTIVTKKSVPFVSVKVNKMLNQLFNTTTFLKELR